MTVRIENLQCHTGSIEGLSVRHFDLWGPLTSRNTLGEDQSLLERAVAADGLPKYYEGLGWSRLDEVEYLDKLRVIMAYNIEIAV